VLGIDVSPAAVELARRESRSVGRIAFRQTDITADGAGDDLAGDGSPPLVLAEDVQHPAYDDLGRSEQVRGPPRSVW